MKGVDDRSLTLTLEPADYAEDCRPALFSSTLPPERPPMWVLGQPLLRSYISVYDLQQRRVGFQRSSARLQRPPPTPKLRGGRRWARLHLSPAEADAE
ncbi:Dolichyl-phosphate-mannose--protein mannosyltransferase [Durusdinium trenchii]|uniref:Dolichyl-phosphate-mannose--protein mannosyltransferase n=1 Tax=Durusdinium trenchii TaxID=1381693 RepID=A0ABP0RDU0_9DINO